MKKPIRNILIITAGALCVFGSIGLSNLPTKVRVAVISTISPTVAMLLAFHYSEPLPPHLIQVVKEMPGEGTLYSQTVEIAHTQWQKVEGIWTTHDGWRCHTDEDGEKVDHYLNNHEPDSD